MDMADEFPDAEVCQTFLSSPLSLTTYDYDADRRKFARSLEPVMIQIPIEDED